MFVNSIIFELPLN